MAEVGFFVDLFEAECFFKGDAAGLSVGDEAQVADEEDLLLENGFGFNPVELCRECR